MRKKLNHLLLFLLMIVFFVPGILSCDVLHVEAASCTIYDMDTIRLMDNKTPTASEKKAVKEFYYILDHYADPVYHMKDSQLDKLTKKQIKELKKAAKNITKGCKDDYSKIKAVTEYLADYLYYDYYYYDSRHKYNNNDVTTYFDSYDVYKNRISVCQGFSNLTKTLLNLSGVPCMILYGNNHGFNAAYASELKRWVVFDVTWCSKNKYTVDNEWVKEKHTLERFDLKADDLVKLSSHEGLVLKGIKTNDGMYYTFYMGDIFKKQCDPKIDESDIDFSKWSDTKKWYFEVDSARKKNAKASAKIYGYPVKGVKQYAFYENTKVKNIDLSALKGSLGKVDDYMFYKCGSLKTVKLPAGIKKIGKCAFSYCNSLTKVNLPKQNISSIGAWAFYQCGSLKCFKFNPKIKKIGKCAFYECKKLDKVDLSKTKIRAIKEYTFLSCVSVKKVSFPKSLKTIGRNAFYDNENLTGTLDFSRTKLQKAGYASFYNDANITEIKLPKTLKLVDEFAFGVSGRIVNTEISGPFTKSSLDSISNSYAWCNRNLEF